MIYVARKFVRFDRGYAIGEEIPDGVVSPARAAELLSIGLIAEKRAEAARTPQNAVDAPGGVSAHPEAETAAGGKQGGKAAAKRSAKRKETAKEA